MVLPKVQNIKKRIEKLSFDFPKLGEIVRKQVHLFAFYVVLIFALSFVLEGETARAHDVRSSKFSHEALQMAKNYGRLVRAMRRGQFIDAQGNRKYAFELENDTFQGTHIDCKFLAYSIYYHQYQKLIDDYKTTPFHSVSDFLRNRYDTRIPTDPRKVIVQVKDGRIMLDLYVQEEAIAKRTYATGGANAGVCSQYLKAVGLLRSN